MQPITNTYKITFDSQPVAVLSNGDWLKILGQTGQERYYKMATLISLSYWSQRSSSLGTAAVFAGVIGGIICAGDVLQSQPINSYGLLALIVAMILLVVWYINVSTSIILVFHGGEKVKLSGNTSEMQSVWSFLEQRYSLQ